MKTIDPFKTFAIPATKLFLLIIHAEHQHSERCWIALSSLLSPSLLPMCTLALALQIPIWQDPSMFDELRAVAQAKSSKPVPAHHFLLSQETVEGDRVPQSGVEERGFT